MNDEVSKMTLDRTPIFNIDIPKTQSDFNKFMRLYDQFIDVYTTYNTELAKEIADTELIQNVICKTLGQRRDQQAQYARYFQMECNQYIISALPDHLKTILNLRWCWEHNLLLTQEQKDWLLKHGKMTQREFEGCIKQVSGKYANFVEYCRSKDIELDQTTYEFILNKYNDSLYCYCYEMMPIEIKKDFRFFKRYIQIKCECMQPPLNRIFKEINILLKENQATVVAKALHFYLSGIVDRIIIEAIPGMYHYVDGKEIMVAESAYLHVHIPLTIKAKYPQYEQSNDKDFISELVTNEWKQWSHTRKVI